MDIRVIKNMQYWNLIAFVVLCVYREMVQLYIFYSFNYAIASLGRLTKLSSNKQKYLLDGINFDPPAGCWNAPGFRHLWRYHDAGQHNILKERVFKERVLFWKKIL